MYQQNRYYPYYPIYQPFPFQGTYYQNPYVVMPNNQQQQMVHKKGKEPIKTNNSLPIVDKSIKDNNKSHDVLKQLEKIHDKLNQLEEENKQMKEEIENKKTINVENVNYKIQDLHVEDLSGTLLVGLTSWGDAEELQELLKENGPVMFNDINTEDMEDTMMNEESNNDQNENEE